MAAAPPLSRDHAAGRSNEFGASQEEFEWGPNSIPPVSTHNVPWDEQIVPALRKRLEQESAKLDKRITRIEKSDGGWANASRDSFEKRKTSNQPRSGDSEAELEPPSSSDATLLGIGYPATPSKGNSIKQQTASAHLPRHGSLLGYRGERVRSVSTIARQHSTSSRPSQSFGTDPDATARARERARRLAKERAAKQGSPLPSKSSRDYEAQHPIDSSPLGRSFSDERSDPQSFPSSGASGDGATPDEAKQHNSGVRGNRSSFEQSRARTQSSPHHSFQGNPKMKSAAATQGVGGRQLPVRDKQGTPSRMGGFAESSASPPTTLARPHQDGQENDAFASGLPAQAPHPRSESQSSTLGYSMASKRASTISAQAYPASSLPSRGKSKYSPPTQDELDEFGPLGGLPKSERGRTTPLRSGSRRANGSPAQPDAFQSLSPKRSLQAPSPALARTTGSNTVDGIARDDLLAPSTAATPGAKARVMDWDEEIIPVVAKKLEQQRIMAGDPRLSRVDGLIDTWDRNGLPLSKSQFGMPLSNGGSLGRHVGGEASAEVLEMREMESKSDAERDDGRQEDSSLTKALRRPGDERRNGMLAAGGHHGTLAPNHETDGEVDPTTSRVVSKKSSRSNLSFKSHHSDRASGIHPEQPAEKSLQASYSSGGIPYTDGPHGSDLIGGETQDQRVLRKGLVTQGGLTHDHLHVGGDGGRGKKTGKAKGKLEDGDDAGGCKCAIM
ncbi:hypothetical protein IE53DRAFT_28649 [Violaceomyces palustris]|uniref:Uncharacterized protein n=1 Tax=Violaceomyces palustris TaxID=1673888 RepID=A0ACD0P1H2_9BASI|nr:hypothetical protein IE53DRAFT_28649 [Violaceomyces palustris]